jgi:hypothetical protein
MNVCSRRMAGSYAALPSRSNRATAGGSSYVGRCPQPGSGTLRTDGGRSRGRATSRSCSGQPSVTCTVIGEALEPRRAYRAVDVGEARRRRVGADEVLDRRARDALGMRGRPGHRQPSQAVAGEQRAERRQCRARGAPCEVAARCQRPRPQTGRGDRRDRARGAGQRRLQCDPAAERVAGHVGPLDAVGRGRAAEAGQVDRDDGPLGLQQRHDRVPHRVVAAQRVQQHEHRARAPSLVGDH